VILCVTPNPAIDRTVIVDPTGSAISVHDAAGGKGINVARAIRAFGEAAIASGPLGGATGRTVAQLADAEGLVGEWTWIEGIETRLYVCTVGGASTTADHGRAPHLSPEQWNALVDDTRRAAADADAVVISGSMPAGVPTAGLGDLIGAAAGRPGWVDLSGPALASVVKVNRHEASELVGDGELADLAARLAARSGGRVVVTGDASGAALCDAGEVYVAFAPSIEARNATGSGDCFLAAMILALVAGRPAEEALRMGVAAGTENARHPVVHIDPNAVADLAAAVTIEGPVRHD
jgi:1-phosphofructokinase family hexose kinase